MKYKRIFRVNLDLSPALKWAGGKRWLISHLKPLWASHEHRRLVEPFCGGLAIALGLLPQKALLNDINPHLINFYAWLKKGLRTTLPMKNELQLYYSHRKRFNELIQQKKTKGKESAELFYFLNRTGYNGLCRFNGSGGFNVPFGKYTNIDYTTDFTSYQPIFSQWEFKDQDFENLKLRDDDLIYADPPYDVEFTHYAKKNFNWEDQVRLARWLRQHPGPVILSNQATPRIMDLYKSLGFSIQILSAPRMISCNGNRSRAQEILATRNLGTRPKFNFPHG